MSDTAVAEPGTRLQNFLDRAGLRGFPWKTATILYTISWGWLLVVRDSYWSDDWNLFPRHALKLSESAWSLMGYAPWLKLQIDFFGFVGPTAFRLIIFAAYFIIAILLFSIASQVKVLGILDKSFFVLLVLMLPFNTARVALMTFPYTIGFMIFCLGWCLYLNSNWQVKYLVALPIFFFSFMLHSLLFFVFLPICLSFFDLPKKNFLETLNWLKKNISLILTPLIYVVMRTFFWPEVTAYHEIDFNKLLGTADFVGAFCILSFLLIVLERKFIQIRNGIRLISLGIVSSFFGIYAYVLLGFYDTNWSIFSKFWLTFLGRSDWYSRHQILQQFGAALLVVGLTNLTPKLWAKQDKHVQISTLTCCVLLNVGFGFEYIIDYQKQKEIVHQLSAVDASESRANYQFIDQTMLLNARGRVFRDNRDWEGLIWLGRGVEEWRLSKVSTACDFSEDTRLVLIQGPGTHWEALKNWVGDGDMGFKVTVDDSPGACKPEMVTSEKVSGAIPILFYFTGANG